MRLHTCELKRFSLKHSTNHFKGSSVKGAIDPAVALQRVVELEDIILKTSCDHWRSLNEDQGFTERVSEKSYPPSTKVSSIRGTERTPTRKVITCHKCGQQGHFNSDTSPGSVHREQARGQETRGLWHSGSHAGGRKRGYSVGHHHHLFREFIPSSHQHQLTESGFSKLTRDQHTQSSGRTSGKIMNYFPALGSWCAFFFYVAAE